MADKTELPSTRSIRIVITVAPEERHSGYVFSNQLNVDSGVQEGVHRVCHNLTDQNWIDPILKFRHRSYSEKKLRIPKKYSWCGSKKASFGSGRS